MAKVWGIYNGLSNEAYLQKGKAYIVVPLIDGSPRVLVNFNDKFHVVYNVNQFNILDKDEREFLELIYA